MTARPEAARPEGRPARTEEPSRRRRIVRRLEEILPLVGVVVVFASVALLADRWMQVAGTLVGLLLVEAGIWNLASVVGIRERRYHALRGEVDRFLGLVRTLNRTATGAESDDQETPAVVARMHDAVDRMAAVAAEEGGTRS